MLIFETYGDRAEIIRGTDSDHDCAWIGISREEGEKLFLDLRHWLAQLQTENVDLAEYLQAHVPTHSQTDT